MRLTTDRLLLRPYEAADRARFVGWFTDPILMAHLDGPMSTEQADTLFSELVGERPLRDRVHTAWATCREGVLIAHAVLLNETGGTEIGYLVDAAHHGRGYATEIAAALIAHAHLTLGIPRLIATVDADNPASIRVLDKVGMVPLRQEEDEDGAWWVYSWQPSPA